MIADLDQGSRDLCDLCDSDWGRGGIYNVHTMWFGSGTEKESLHDVLLGGGIVPHSLYT